MRAVTLSVQLTDGSWLTPRSVSSLNFVKTAPGGCASATAVIEEADWIDRLGATCQVNVSCARTSRVLWSGRVKDGGRSVTSAENRLTLDIEGSAQYLTDQQQWLPYAVTALDSWHQDTSAPHNKMTASAEVGSLPDGSNKPALVMSMPQGVINPGDAVRMTFGGSLNSTMKLGGFSAGAFSGVNTASDSWASNNFSFNVYWGDPALKSIPYTNVGGQLNPSKNFQIDAGDTNAPENTWGLTVEWTFAGIGSADGKSAPTGYTSTSDSIWCSVFNITVWGECHDRYGGNQVWNPAMRGGHLPHHIVEDLMSRMLSQWVHLDPNVSDVSNASVQLIDKLDYSGSNGPVTAQRVLDDLVKALGDSYYYYVGPRQNNGQYPLSWRQWPSKPRYQAPAGSVVWDSQGSSQPLANQVMATWTDTGGTTQTVTVTADPLTYPDIANLKTTRQAVISLDQSVGSASTATTIAKAYLAQVATRPKAGSVTIDRPIVDLMTGAVTFPSSIEPGQRIIIPETGDKLRITEVDYDASKDSAVLKLENPMPDLDQLLAGLHRRYTLL